MINKLEYLLHKHNIKDIIDWFAKLAVDALDVKSLHRLILTINFIEGTCTLLALTKEEALLSDKTYMDTDYWCKHLDVY